MRPLRLHLMCLAASFLALPALGDDPQDPQARAEQELQRLTKLFEQQRTEVKTAEIEADHFIYHTKETVREPAIDEFLAGLEKLLTTDDVLNVDLKNATDALPEPFPQAVWRSMILFVDGVKRRVAEDWTYPNGKSYSLDAAFDGTNTTSLNYLAGKPTVTPGDTLGNITRLSHLHGYPETARSGPIRLADPKPAGGNPVDGAWNIRVFPQSGFVHEIRRGRFRSLHYQHATLDGVVIPRVTVMVRMENDSLHFLEIYRIRSALFNKDLPVNAFVVAPRGPQVR